MEPEKSGITLTESGQIVPDQSTAAIIAHHPEAEYFILWSLLPCSKFKLSDIWLVAYLPEERGAMMKTLHVDWQLIMVNDMIMNKLNPEDKQYVIAHELAHVYLKYEQNPFNEKNKDFEQ